MESICDECGKKFDPIEQGKNRMGETFCSIECADKAYPEIKAKNDAFLREIQKQS